MVFTVLGIIIACVGIGLTTVAFAFSLVKFVPTNKKLNKFQMLTSDDYSVSVESTGRTMIAGKFFLAGQFLLVLGAGFVFADAIYSS